LEIYVFLCPFSSGSRHVKGLLSITIILRVYPKNNNVIARRMLIRRSNLQLDKEIASGKEHTCPGERCQGERPRNDMNRKMFEF
jgi:hypothetical protein